MRSLSRPAATWRCARAGLAGLARPREAATPCPPRPAPGTWTVLTGTWSRNNANIETINNAQNTQNARYPLPPGPVTRRCEAAAAARCGHQATSQLGLDYQAMSVQSDQQQRLCSLRHCHTANNFLAEQNSGHFLVILCLIQELPFSIGGDATLNSLTPFL